MPTEADREILVRRHHEILSEIEENAREQAEEDKINPREPTEFESMRADLMKSQMSESLLKTRAARYLGERQEAKARAKSLDLQLNSEVNENYRLKLELDEIRALFDAQLFEVQQMRAMLLQQLTMQAQSEIEGRKIIKFLKL
jgi:hypothetical protein